MVAKRGHLWYDGGAQRDNSIKSVAHEGPSSTLLLCSLSKGVATDVEGGPLSLESKNQWLPSTLCRAGGTAPVMRPLFRCRANPGKTKGIAG